MRTRLWLGFAVAAATVAASAAQAAPIVSIFTIAGTGTGAFAGDGKPGTTASLDGPAGLAALPDGSIVVADTINQRIRRIDAPAQRIRAFAGTGKLGFAGDGGPATRANFQDPTAVALGKGGVIFVADTGNSRIRVIRADGTIATIAGTADQGFSGDGGPAPSAQVNAPAGLAVDGSGRLFFSDSGNNRVRLIDLDGTITTIAGTGQAGSGGDGGPAKAAQLRAPAGLAVAADGSLLIADSGNNRVRRIALDGTIATVAGTGGGGSGGDGGPAPAAQLNLPVDVAAIPGGGFFVAEQGGNRVRRVDAGGTITRVAGTGGPRYGGDGGSATRALLNAPRAVELMPSGVELLIADTDNNRIRSVAVPGQGTLLGLAILKPSFRGKLVKKAVEVKGKKRRVLVVRNVKLALRLTRESNLTFRLRRKTGGTVAIWRAHLGPGIGAAHLPPKLLAGKRRLTKDHYVVGVTAKSGTASAAAAAELVVK
jgi:hypothetical protein